MRNLKQFQVKARQPKTKKFGDFKITDINKRSKTALADFGDGCTATINIVPLMTQLKEYSPKRKTFYVSAV